MTNVNHDPGLRNPNRVVARLGLILLLGLGALGLACHNSPTVDPTPEATGTSLVSSGTATRSIGNGGYTGSDGKCHIGPPAPWENGCVDGQPIPSATPQR